jgi:two-component system phosphate regulon sensor histidine kinase PhoR
MDTNSVNNSEIEEVKRINELLLNQTEQNKLLQSELDSVFNSIISPLILVDSRIRILRFNTTAAKLFNVDPDVIPGLELEKISGSQALTAFALRIATSPGQHRTEIRIETENGEDQVFDCSGQQYMPALRKSPGAVILLNNITLLRKLENMRTDFVANVSHELRTPIASIQGSVETLIDGAKDEPESLDKFLNIIAKHSIRLGNIISDLLWLSRIEQDAANQGIDFKLLSLNDIVQTAVELCEHAASLKSSTIEMEIAGNFYLRANARLLEQAIVNLLDNAIKYSHNGSEIKVTVKTVPGSILLHVSDNGPGIAAEHLDRIFERFYRVDKARSRTLGGTGLGLALVKHIAQAHGGSVGVSLPAASFSRTLR